MKVSFRGHNQRWDTPYHEAIALDYSEPLELMLVLPLSGLTRGKERTILRRIFDKFLWIGVRLCFHNQADFRVRNVRFHTCAAELLESFRGQQNHIFTADFKKGVWPSPLILPLLIYKNYFVKWCLVYIHLVMTISVSEYIRNLFCGKWLRHDSCCFSQCNWSLECGWLGVITWYAKKW